MFSADNVAGAVIVLAIALAAIGGIWLVVFLLRARCPACRKPTLELDVRDNAGGIVAGNPNAQMFQCRTCQAEFRREVDGPLIPRHAWEAGARDDFPRATLKR